MNKIVGGELFCSNHRGDSQAPHGVSHIDSGLENVDDVEDDGGKSAFSAIEIDPIVAFHVRVLVQEKAEKKAMNGSEHAAGMVAITEASILGREDTMKF